MQLTDLIAAAPWREAIAYRDTRPHEYVLLRKDDEREVVLNRARLYHDRRDFYVEDGDTRMQDDYPGVAVLDEARRTKERRQ